MNEGFSYKKALVKLAAEKFDDLPIIIVTEFTEAMRSLEGFDFGGSYTIDLQKLTSNLDDDYEISYVYEILRIAILGSADYIWTTTNRKNSFGDTPEWWLQYSPDNLKNRKTIEIDVIVG